MSENVKRKSMRGEMIVSGESMEREDVMLEGENNRQQKDKDENEENKGDE
jgi:hypothetical protein